MDRRAAGASDQHLPAKDKKLATKKSMAEIRRVAAAYYKHLPENDKKELKKKINAMDKNGDKQISQSEYMEYINEGKAKGFDRQRIFTALDMDGNRSLDFEEAKVLFYIMKSGRAIICMSCEKFMAGAYFSCSKCFLDRAKSNFDICCDCYGSGKKIKHHDDAIFCDNYTLLSRSRSSALAAPEEEIRRVAAAYYKHLPENDKKELKKKFNAMDKNGDKQISPSEYMEYINEGKAKGFDRQRIFTALDMDGNRSLDFEEAKVLFYIMKSGRAIICMSCEKFMAGAYFSCSKCFFDRAKSNFDICYDCYGSGKKIKHHDDAIFCDNYTLLSRSRSSAVAAPEEEIRRVAAAYYKHLPQNDKKELKKKFNAMDKNGDKQISPSEYMEYINEGKAKGFDRQRIFTALDMDGNRSLDFEEAKVLFYIMKSGRAIICMSCEKFMAGAYFSCSKCFFDRAKSNFDICYDCYGSGKKIKHHDDAIFCDNYTLLSRSRSSAVAAPEEEIRRVAAAYYKHLPENDKKELKKKFNAMDKNGDKQISPSEYMEYINEGKAKGFDRQRIFTALDMDGNRSLDFEEAKVLFYIMKSGRAIICMSCEKFMAGAYFSCSKCFFDRAKSNFDICCDCYGSGKKIEHHDDAIFCDNYTLLSRSRSSAVAAPEEVVKRALQAIEKIVHVAIIAGNLSGCIIM